MLLDDAMRAVPLRPHHGMCLAYFEGSGYSEGFTKHMQEMLELLETDRQVKLTAAVDEICSVCPNNVERVCKDSIKVKKYDCAVLEQCGISEGQELGFHEFALLVQKHIIASGRRTEICGDCQWDGICRNKKSRWESLQRED